MKNKFILLSMLAVATLFSCSDKSDVSPDNPSTGGSNDGKTRLTLNISTPTVERNSRADGTPDAGTDVEKKISSLALACYDVNNNVTYYELFPTVTGNKVVTSNEVVGSSVNIFVIANPPTDVSNAMEFSTTFDELNVAQTVDAGVVSTADEFMMTNTTGLVAITKPDAGVAGNFSAEVMVSRVVAKIVLGAVPTDLTGTDTANPNYADVATFKNVILTATNKVILPFSEYVAYTPTGEAELPNSYRVDANYDTALDNALIWANEATYFGTGTDGLGRSMYCLENTVAAANQNEATITKLLIKATYQPETYVADAHWFKYRGNTYTLKSLQEYCAEPGTAALAKEELERFAVALGATDMASLSTTELDATDAVKKASHVSPYVVNFYQNSVCYYPVNLKHDARVDAPAVIAAGALGRWGTVRNNSYVFTVTRVKGVGSPYMPDPTDPDIVDPENPDPEIPVDPEDSALLDVTVTVAPWATWEDSGEIG